MMMHIAQGEGQLAEREPQAVTEVEAGGAVQRHAYQLFITFVSLNALLVLICYYLVPLPEPVRQVLRIIDVVNAIVFLVDFFAQLTTSSNKLRYLITWGWVDLLGSLPLHPLLRLVRIVHSLRITRRLIRVIPADIRRAARRRLAENTLFAVAGLVVFVVTAGSVAIAAIEPRAPGANIVTGSDAVWWVFVTVATVGYGDRYPVTDAGRVVGVMLILVGVAAFSVLTSYIASMFLARRR